MLGHPADLDEPGDDAVDSTRSAQVDHEIGCPFGEAVSKRRRGARFADPGDENVGVGRQMRDFLGQRGDDERGPATDCHPWTVTPKPAGEDGVVRKAVPAPVLVLGGVASVQGGAAIATKLFPQAGPGGTVWLRIALSALLLLAIARPSLAGRSAADLRLVIALGLALAGMNLTFYEALDRIPLGVAVTIEFIGPLSVAVLGSRRRRDLVWVALAAIGVVLLASGGGGLDGTGVLLAFGAGVLWAAYILLTQRVGAVFPGASGLALALVVGAVGLAPIGIVSGGGALVDPGVIGRGCAVALLSSAIPYTLEMYALRRLRAAVFGVLMSLEPAFAALSGLVFLSQHLRGREWAAVACVMSASIGATRDARRDELPVEPGATPTEMVPV